MAIGGQESIHVCTVSSPISRQTSVILIIYSSVSGLKDNIEPILFNIEALLCLFIVYEHWLSHPVECCPGSVGILLINV